MDFKLSDIFAVTLDPLQIIVTLLLALAVGLFIFFIYKKTFGGVMYSRSYNVSLIMLTMVSTMMLLIINSSLALSLGMVGALSIVRFRTAVKDPIDTVFMFWAVGEGVALGAKLYDIALIGALVIGAVMAVVCMVRGRGSAPYLLIVHYGEEASQQIKQLVKQLPQGKLKSKTVQRDGIELTMEVRLKDNETGFVEKFIRVPGVFDATLISHQGDIVS